MVPLAGTTTRAPAGPTSAYDGASGRLGSSWRAQPCWRGSPVAPHRRREGQRQRRRPASLQPRSALLDPPPFDPSKLSIEYLPGGRDPELGAGRRYTLTHNDVTGSLQLAIGREYNRRQLDGWYTRILRDEILAEWQHTAPPVPAAARAGDVGGPGAAASSGNGAACYAPRPSLHVFCHVSGEELWPAPPQLRSFIFQREMALVLDTIAHAERGPGGLFAAAPHLASAPVYVHLRSDLPALDRVVEWGVLGERASWRTATSSVMRSLLSSVMGTIDEADSVATDGSNGYWSRTSFNTASASASWDEAACAAAGGWDAAAAAAAAASSSSSEDEQLPPPPQVRLPQQQQQQQQAPQLGNGAGVAVPLPPPLASSQGTAVGSSSLVNGNGALAPSTNGALAPSSNGALVPSSNGALVPSSNGASPRVPPSVGGSSSMGAANGAVSLVAAQQTAAERVAGSWLGASPAAGEATPQRVPAAVEVVARRHR